MERVLVSLRELVSAIGLQDRAAEIEAEALMLLKAHESAVADEATVGQRPENKALAICYIAANRILLPKHVSYDAMIRAAANTPTWRSEPVPSKNGMTKLIQRFARRICPIEHDPEIVEKAGLTFTVCTRCHYILRTGGPVERAADEEPEDAEHAEPSYLVRGGLHGYVEGTSFNLDEPLEDRPSNAGEKTTAQQMGDIKATGTTSASVETGSPEETLSIPVDAEETLEDVLPGNDKPDASDSEVTSSTRKKWLASAMLQAKKIVKEHPVLKDAVPGAMALVKRSIDMYITSDKVLGSLVQKVVKMALLHESKVQNLPVTSKDLNIQPSDYLKFLAASSTTVAQPATTSDASIVERALDIIAAHSHKPIDEETRERITRFQAVARRKLMGFSPAMAASVIAFIDIARHDPSVVLSKVASIAGINTSSLYNATGRFLEKIGRAGNPDASLTERVVAAFPPRDK
ncbi:MAG: hypothetical protein Q6353_015045 [Candidatus Sigynarchaeum springense]